MIDIKIIAQRLTDKLNEYAPKDTKFVIMSDGGNFIPDTRKKNSNVIQRYINGEAAIISSTITPVNGVLVSTQTVGVSVLVRIDQSQGFEMSVNPVRDAITSYMSGYDVFGYSIPNRGDFAVSMYGTQPEPGTREVRATYGDSIDYNFTCYYTIIQNGVNSSNQALLFEGEQVPFTSMTLSRVPAADGAAFSDTNGVAKSWVTSTALQISLVVPALINNALTKQFTDYIVNGTNGIFDVDVKLSVLTGENGEVLSNPKRMRFDVGNVSAETINNVGMSITLTEVLETGEVANG